MFFCGVPPPPPLSHPAHYFFMQASAPLPRMFFWQSPTPSCQASFYCFLILSQDNYRMKRRASNLLMPHYISRQAVDTEFLWVIWHLTSINATRVTNMRSWGTSRTKPPSSVVWSMLCLQTQVLLQPADPYWLSTLTVETLPKQALPCRESLFVSSQGLPSHRAFILTSWFRLWQKCCSGSRWSWCFWKPATSLPFLPPCSQLLFLLQVF